jgi:hypothetical protein
MERPYLYDAYCCCREGATWLDVNGCPYDEFVAALGEGITRLFQSRCGKRRWVDSSPEPSFQAVGSRTSQVFVLEEAELFGDPDRTFREMSDFLGEPSDPGVRSVFASQLYRLNKSLAEARASLAEFPLPCSRTDGSAND